MTEQLSARSSDSRARFIAAVFIAALFFSASGASRLEAQDICRSEAPFHFKINTQSFFNAYVGQIAGLTEDIVEWWVLYAAKQWAVQSGAGIKLAYDGRTTVLPHCQAADWTSDGVSVIAAYPTSAIGWANGEDLCTSTRFHFFLTPFPPAQDPNFHPFDLVGVLIHEFGHLFGLRSASTCLPGQVGCDTQGHFDFTVMGAGIIQGTPMLRNLTGNDILRMRNKYKDAKNQDCTRAGGGFRYAKAMNILSGFGGARPEVALNSQVFGAPGAALVPISSTQQIFLSSRVVYDLDGPRTPHGSAFTRLDVAPDQSLTHPVEVSYPTLKTHFAPAIAGKQGLALAAFTGYQDFYYKCFGVWIAKSNNLFSTLTTTQLTGDCTLRQPALAYDPASQRFILAYVFQSSQVQSNSDAPGDPLQDIVIVRTSTDGTTWSAPQQVTFFNFPVKSSDTPGVACNSSGLCILTATTSYQFDGRPYPFAFQFRVGATGQVTIGTSGGAADPSHANGYHVGAAVSFGEWFWHTQWADPSDRLNGGITYDQVTPNPPTATTDFNFGIPLNAGASLFPTQIAGTPAASWTYTVTVR